MVVAVYNGYTIPNITDKFHFSISYDKMSFSCVFVVLGTTAADLVSRCDAAEAALNNWNKNFTLTFGGTAEYSYSHSDNTGFLGRTSLGKAAGKIDLALSRSYHFSFNCQLPADESGYNFRQEASVAVLAPIKSRRTISVAGKYTAGGSNSAYQNYTTYGPTWSDAIVASFGTFELLDDHTSYESENKVLQFRRQYQEKQSLIVVYNSYTIPTSYNNFSWEESYEGFSFSCEFKVAKASQAAAEIALRIYNKDLTVKVGGVDTYSYKHSVNTGLLTTPTLHKIDNKSDNENYVFYKFSCRGELPADAVGYGYRRSGSYTINYADSRRRTVNFTVLYTAGGALTSLATYLAGAATWAAGVLAALGGTYEKISESINLEQENKIAKATMVYHELLARDSSSLLNHASITNVNTDYKVQLMQEVGHDPTGQFSAENIVNVAVAYSASLDSTLVVETDIEMLYRTVIKPWIIEHSYDVLNLGQVPDAGNFYITQAESYDINPHTYKFSGHLQFTALAGGNKVIMVKERQSIQFHTGIVHQKIWDGLADTRNMYSTGGLTTMRRTVSIKQLGNEPNEPAPLPPKSSGELWKRLHITRDQEVSLIGVGPRVSFQQMVYLFTTTFAEEYVLVVPKYDLVSTG